MDNVDKENDMQKWEYITIRQSSVPILGGIFYIIGDEKVTKFTSEDSWESIHELLNQLGDRGYELIDASTSATNADVYQRILVIKRPQQ